MPRRGPSQQERVGIGLVDVVEIAAKIALKLPGDPQLERSVRGLQEKPVLPAAKQRTRLNRGRTPAQIAVRRRRRCGWDRSAGRARRGFRRGLFGRWIARDGQRGRLC